MHKAPCSAKDKESRASGQFALSSSTVQILQIESTMATFKLWPVMKFFGLWVAVPNATPYKCAFSPASIMIRIVAPIQRLEGSQ
jgi:hypothetical protein